MPVSTAMRFPLSVTSEAAMLAGSTALILAAFSVAESPLREGPVRGQHGPRGSAQRKRLRHVGEVQQWKPLVEIACCRSDSKLDQENDGRHAAHDETKARSPQFQSISAPDAGVASPGYWDAGNSQWTDLGTTPMTASTFVGLPIEKDATSRMSRNTSHCPASLRRAHRSRHERRSRSMRRCK
jgi:hypothetical protein